MFTAEEYITGWCVYLVSVLGLLVLFWVVTRKLPWHHFKQGLRLGVATVLLVPAIVENSPGFLAPAWVKGLLQLIFTGTDGFMPVAQWMFSWLAIVLFIYMAISVALHYGFRLR